MRGLFRHHAQRDVLRETKTNIEQDNQPTAPQKQLKKETGRNRLPKSKHLVAAFLLAALGNEASHFHETHNPHGNRRERLEEIRRRTQEAEMHSRYYRNATDGPDPTYPVEVAVQEARRRAANGNPANNA